MITSDFSWGKAGRCVRLTTYHPLLYFTSSSTFSILWVQYCNRSDSDTLNKHGKTIEKTGALRFITTENVGLPSREKMSWLRLRSVSLFSCWILLYIAVYSLSVAFGIFVFLLNLAVYCCIFVFRCVRYLCSLAESCCILLYIHFRMSSVSLISFWILPCTFVYCCIFTFGCVHYLCFLAKSCCILLYIRFPLR